MTYFAESAEQLADDQDNYFEGDNLQEVVECYMVSTSENEEMGY